MKNFTLLVLIVLLGISATAQNQFEVLPDKNGGKTFKGIISREVIQSDTSFRWYAENQKAYTPNAQALAGFRKYADSIQVLAFMGTWCEDSHFVIPKFFMLTDAAGFSRDRVTLIGVDRDKKTLSHLSEALNVKNVPTIIIMKNGKEMGRVIEFGKYGMFDKDLADIFSSMDKN